MAGMIKLTFLGDILCQKEQIAAEKRAGCGFNSVFHAVSHLWQGSDYVVGNLETPVAGKALRYAYEAMRFNAPREFAVAIKRAGVNFLSLANNHALDRGVEGLDNTIRTLDELGIDHSGAYSKRVDSDKIFVKVLHGIRFAFISCTYGTNQGLKCSFLPDDELWRVEILKYPDQAFTSTSFMVKRFLSNLIPFSLKKRLSALATKRVLNRIGDSVKEEDFDMPDNRAYFERVCRKITLAREKADVVVVLAHIGGQYNIEPGPWQKRAMAGFATAGADIIVANHAHVPLGFDTIGNTFAAYCLGNFCFVPDEISHQDSRADYSIILHCNFDPSNGKLVNHDYVMAKSIIDDHGMAIVVPADDWRREL